MKTIGGHDYYDISPYDTDTSRIFVRHKTTGERKVKLPIKLDYASLTANSKGYASTLNERGIVTKVGTLKIRETLYFNIAYLIFCGKLYRGVKVSTYPWASGIAKDTIFYWTKDSFLKKLAKHGIKLYTPKSADFLSPRYGDERVTTKSIGDFFTPRYLTPQEMDVILKDEIVLAYTVLNAHDYVKDIKWECNTDILKSIGFPAVFDAWACYQEIDMFLGTILVQNEDKMVKISDASMIAKHGYDKWSFRNQVHPAKPRGA